MAGKSVRWLRSIPPTKPDIRRSRPPIQKKNHSIRATFHTAWAKNAEDAFAAACKPKFSAAKQEGYRARPACNGGGHSNSSNAPDHDCDPRFRGAKERKGERPATETTEVPVETFQ